MKSPLGASRVLFSMVAVGLAMSWASVKAQELTYYRIGNNQLSQLIDLRKSLGYLTDPIHAFWNVLIVSESDGMAMSTTLTAKGQSTLDALAVSLSDDAGTIVLDSSLQTSASWFVDSYESITLKSGSTRVPFALLNHDYDVLGVTSAGSFSFYDFDDLEKARTWFTATYTDSSDSSCHISWEASSTKTYDINFNSKSKNYAVSQAAPSSRFSFYRLDPFKITIGSPDSDGTVNLSYDLNAQLFSNCIYLACVQTNGRTPDQDEMLASTDIMLLNSMVNRKVTVTTDGTKSTLWVMPVYISPDSGTKAPLGRLTSARIYDLPYSDDDSGITDITSTTSPNVAPIYYTLQGVSLPGEAAPSTPGIYILRDGLSTRKVIVK